MAQCRNTGKDWPQLWFRALGLGFPTFSVDAGIHLAQVLVERVAAERESDAEHGGFGEERPDLLEGQIHVRGVGLAEYFGRRQRHAPAAPAGLIPGHSHACVPFS